MTRTDATVLDASPAVSRYLSPQRIDRLISVLLVSGGLLAIATAVVAATTA